MPPVRVDREPPFKLSMTVDFFGDGGRGLYTPRTLELMMREARRMGVTRVYWQYLGDLELDRYGAGTNMLRTPWAKYGPLTLAAIGEPLEAAVRAAHRRGLEIFGVLKPYHTGISATNFRDGTADFENTALGMVQVFGPGPEALPIVVATRDATWIRPRDFRTYGLEFDSGFGTRLFHLDGVSEPSAEGSTPEESQTHSWHEHRAELGRGGRRWFHRFCPRQERVSTRRALRVLSRGPAAPEMAGQPHVGEGGRQRRAPPLGSWDPHGRALRVRFQSSGG